MRKWECIKEGKTLMPVLRLQSRLLTPHAGFDTSNQTLLIVVWEVSLLSMGHADMAALLGVSSKF